MTNVSSSRFLQYLGQPLRHVEHDVVAAWQLVRTPVLGAGAGQASIEIGVRVTGGPDVGLLGDPVAGAGQRQFLNKGLDRLRRALRIDPGTILLIDVEERSATRRHGGGAG